MNAELARIDWRHGLATRNDRVIAQELNWLHALRFAPELRGLVAFNEFSRRLVLARTAPWRECPPGARWENGDDVRLAELMQRLGVPTGPKLAECVDAVGREHSVHPVRDYLESLRHDGRPRLDSWLATYARATGPQPYLRAVGRKFLVSAAARIFQPGCQVDHMLVLQGAQGAGKTSLARTLAVEEDWFRGELPDVTRESYGHLLQGKWIVEISELAALRRTETERMKGCLTQTHDDYRAPYQRRPEQLPRQCVFIGTTNESHYLRDPTGNRRFWPVSCSRIDLEALRRDRDQLWAEAVALYRTRAMWHLTEEEERLAGIEQRERIYMSELEADVNGYLEQLRSAGTAETCVRDVLIYGLHLDPDKSDYSERAQRLGTQVAAALEAAGWRKVPGRSEVGGKKRTVYRCPQGGQGPTGYGA